MRRDLYFFGGGEADGSSELKELLGGKGSNLAEMARLGLPVPPGFTISTEACGAAGAGGKLSHELVGALRPAIARIEQIAGSRFGDPERPLLLSVRSGARVSMPGMMDTVLDLGLNDATALGLARQSGDKRFACDAYRRFCAMYGSVVLGMGSAPFEALLQEARARSFAATDQELTAEALEELGHGFRRIIEVRGLELPQDPFVQLVRAIEAVFHSWKNPRAAAYRKLNGIPESWGTAVTVQAMVFGNLGDNSGTGVAFSRDPASGARGLCGEFLAGAQGEDVVAGVRTPLGITELQERFPAAYAELARASSLLERRFRDLQDIEFTVERGKLWVLQCRSGKRSGLAAVRIAVEMAQEELLTRAEAVARVPAEAIEQMLKPVFDPLSLGHAISTGRLLGHGLPAGPGAACGKLCLTAVEAERRHASGERVILVRRETSAEDIRGMDAAEGLCTAWGGLTSHAALVARQMGKVAVVGVAALSIDEQGRAAVFATIDGQRRVREGELISLDGFGGAVVGGEVATRPSEVIEVLVQGSRALVDAPACQRFVQLLGWADSIRELQVLANADQADQARAALALGAQGIGLVRTEHMFFGADRLGPMREMILAETLPERRQALAKLLPLQRHDFAELFRIMAGTPVTIRTLDPPLHEFLPRDERGLIDLAHASGRPLEQVRRRVLALAETNPMLGLRGCRLGILHPEITEMQAVAIFEAACDVEAEGFHIDVRVMIPLVSDRAELEDQAKVVRAAAAQVFAERGRAVGFRVGTMIEVPRAALTAGEIARVAEFFSFGTNDLTQTTLGLSRDDVAAVLPLYLERGLYQRDPFATVDRAGVGELMRIAKERGRATRPGLELGICGEHGGDPASISFCQELGLDYVSCSPYRVPVARLAAAHAALASKPAAAPRRGAETNTKKEARS